MEANKLTLTTDYAFKKVFGSYGNERILKSFLEAILNKTITDVRVLNPEMPKEIQNGKECILDVKAKIDGKEIVNIEMQVVKNGDMVKRSLYYFSRIFGFELKEGESYDSTQKVIVINILDYVQYNRNAYHSVAKLFFDKTNPKRYIDMNVLEEDTLATDFIEMHFIELPKFKKKYPKIESALEEWLTLFVTQGKNNMTKDIEERVEEIREAEKELQRLRMDRVAFEEYESRQKWLHDQASALEYATKTGKAEGEKTKSIEVAKELIKEGMTVEFISKVTKLSLEEINKLVEN